MGKVTNTDRIKFKAYMRSCTNPECWSEYDKEMSAKRIEYASMALAEIVSRGLKRDSSPDPSAH
jgi:hypothetical protein